MVERSGSGKRPAQVALIGFGLAGEVFHAPLIAATPGLELATIVTADPARAARAAARYPNARVVPEIAAVTDEALVVIATPNRHHVPLATAVLDRGQAVVVDKPLATTLADAKAICAHPAAARLTVFQNRRWDGDFMTARALLHEDLLGVPIRLTSRFIRFRPEIRPGWREHGDPKDGPGQLLDLGSHLIDQALQLFGPAESVYAELGMHRTGALADDDVFIALRHVNGAHSHLHMSAIAAVPGARLELTGTAGGFRSMDLDVQEEQLRGGLTPGAAGYGENPPGARFDAAGTHRQELARGDYPAFYRAVPAWLAGEAVPPVDPGDSAAVLAVIEAARRSLTTDEAD